VTTVDLAPRAVDIVLAILARYVPDREVRVMGSRSSGRSKPFSDLDLVVMGEEPLPLFDVAQGKRRDAVTSRRGLPEASDRHREQSVAERGRKLAVVQHDAAREA
jgi:predicted nucleotidyltransferase